MNIPEDHLAPPPPRRKLWLLGLPALAALAWIGLHASHKPQGLRQTLTEFQGDNSGESGPNHAMASVLTIRQSLLSRPTAKLSAEQAASLVTIVNTPVNELSQSEALDALIIARRANDLSPLQTKQAQDAAILVLQHNPAPMVRLESARFLGHLGGDSHSVTALTALQGDSDPKVKAAASLALSRFPKPAP